MSDQLELERIAEVIAAGPFTDTWESLAAYEPPRWFVDGKFGIFIHWGVYSVPAFGNEWYARYMYVEDARSSSTTAPPTGLIPVRLQGLH